MTKQTEQTRTDRAAAAIADPMMARIMRRIGTARTERDAETAATAAILSKLLTETAADSWYRAAADALRNGRPPYALPMTDDAERAAALALLRDIANA